ncbi:MAG: hypothetical protein ACTSUE_16595 [Promethearchaeota archaeon]
MNYATRLAWAGDVEEVMPEITCDHRDTRMKFHVIQCEASSVRVSLMKHSITF